MHEILAVCFHFAASNDPENSIWHGDGLQFSPQDIEILGLCPVGPVLPYGEKVPLWLWLATLLVTVS